MSRSLEQLGKEIIDHIKTGDDAAHDSYYKAGLLLIEAKKKRDDIKFPDFLKKYCSNLGRTRALELIAIAKGRTTTKEINAKGNERKKRHRANKRESVPERTVIELPRPQAPNVVTPARDPSPVNLDPGSPVGNFISAVCLCFSKMNDAEKEWGAAFAVKMSQPGVNLDRAAHPGAYRAAA
jgi:hypothetical protein